MSLTWTQDITQLFSDLNTIALTNKKIIPPPEAQNSDRDAHPRHKRLLIQTAIENFQKGEVSLLARDGGKFEIGFVPLALELGQV